MRIFVNGSLHDMTSSTATALAYLMNAAQISLPEWWQDQLMTLLPKNQGTHDLAKIRPISLFEVIRKLWAGMVAKRVQRAWQKHSLLHSNQHGFRPQHGTHTAILHVLNRLEGPIPTKAFASLEWPSSTYRGKNATRPCELISSGSGYWTRGHSIHADFYCGIRYIANATGRQRNGRCTCICGWPGSSGRISSGTTKTSGSSVWICGLYGNKDLSPKGGGNISFQFPDHVQHPLSDIRPLETAFWWWILDSISWPIPGYSGQPEALWKSLCTTFLAVPHTEQEISPPGCQVNGVQSHCQATDKIPRRSCSMNPTTVPASGHETDHPL